MFFSPQIVTIQQAIHTVEQHTSLLRSKWPSIKQQSVIEIIYNKKTNLFIYRK